MLKRAILTAEDQRRRKQIPYIGDTVRQVSHIDGDAIADIVDAIFRTPIERQKKKR